MINHPENTDPTGYYCLVGSYRNAPAYVVVVSPGTHGEMVNTAAALVSRGFIANPNLPYLTYSPEVSKLLGNRQGFNMAFNCLIPIACKKGET